MPKHRFREEALAAVERARALMVDGAELPALQYAALETRLAMEALTYDRAQAYSRDLPKSEIGTWQPKKVLAVLLALDPMADSDKSLSMSKGPATEADEDFEDMFDFGTETVLNMKAVKDHYDAIGNRLHMPTIKQMEDTGAHEPERLRQRLERALTHLEKVLASPISNLTVIGRNSQIDCMRCGHRIRRAVEDNAARTKARCPECGLGYDLVPNKKDDFDWHPEKSKMKCSNPECPEELTVYRDELKLGLVVTCAACGQGTLVVFGSRPAVLPPEGDSPTLQIKSPD